MVHACLQIFRATQTDQLDVFFTAEPTVTGFNMDHDPSMEPSTIPSPPAGLSLKSISFSGTCRSFLTSIAEQLSRP